MELVINILSVGAIVAGYAILRWVLAPNLAPSSDRIRSREAEGPAPAIGGEYTPAASFLVYPVSDSAPVRSVSPGLSPPAANGTASSLAPAGEDHPSSTHDAA